MSKILFLCTGNYYRSRFAELFFNELARQIQLNWSSDSRGLAPEFNFNNIGPISPFALERLVILGLKIPSSIRYPIRVEENDLSQADRVIALNDVEHRPYFETRYLCYTERVEYWNIKDIDQVLPAQALLELEYKVRELIDQLAIVKQVV
ncbi:MAG: low molecular weight phosphatase family protein [Acidobacteriota bacterium]